MNASSILRSAALALTLAAVGVRESSAQAPLYSNYGTTVGQYYSAAPAIGYGTSVGPYVNRGVYSGPMNGPMAGAGFNPSIAAGGCHGPVNNGSAYLPSYPYGTAANDYYWNSQYGNQYANQFGNQYGNQWNGAWNNQWNNRWNAGPNIGQNVGQNFGWNNGVWGPVNDGWRNGSSSSTWSHNRNWNHDHRFNHSTTSTTTIPSTTTP